MSLFPKNGYKAALYCRLSRDEDSKQESNSIVNQRRILTEYAEQNHFPVAGVYVDDGVSGVTFERPGFTQMMADVREGKVNMVIVKDLSRLGRNHTKADQHIEEIFPDLGVRFIAIGDGYDSMFDDEPSADMVPLLNFFNEFHAKQSSKKSRASKKSTANAGLFVGSKAPFGYIIDPQDKHHLLVDEDAVETVKLIFGCACDGLGYKAIARRLREAGVLNPTAYNNIKFPTHHKSEYWRQSHDWHPSSIKTILTNPTYLGKVVSGRRRVKSFKDKSIITMPEDEWIVVDGKHEAIIDQRTWDLAQEKIEVRKRSDNQGAVQIFAGLLKCADCGYSLAYHSKGGNGRYQCSLYNVKGKGYCSSHFVTYNALYEVVLADVRRRAEVAANMDEYLLDRLRREASGKLENTAKKAERECQKLGSRIEELDTIIGRLYEDSALERITQERFQLLRGKYEAEQTELKMRRDVMMEAVRQQELHQSENEAFRELLARYKDISELDAPTLNSLITRIEVGKREVIDGVKRQQIRVIYKHYCYAEAFPEDELFGDWSDELNEKWLQIERALDERFEEMVREATERGEWPVKYVSAGYL